MSKRHWVFVLSVGLVAASVWGARTYADGGGHLRLAGGYTSGPVLLNDEYHLIVPLLLEGGPIDLRSVDATATGPGEVRVQLVRVGKGAADGGSFTGPLPDEYEVVPLRGFELARTQRTDGHTGYALDVMVATDRTEATGIDSLEITYDAGRFRSRNAVLTTPLCIRGVADMTTATSPMTGPPDPSTDACVRS